MLMHMSINSLLVRTQENKFLSINTSCHAYIFICLYYNSEGKKVSQYNTSDTICNLYFVMSNTYLYVCSYSYKTFTVAPKSTTAKKLFSFKMVQQQLHMFLLKIHVQTQPGLQSDFVQHMNQTILSVLPVTEINYLYS